MKNRKHKFKVGDEVIITGDSAQWGHGFQKGVRGKIEELQAFDALTNSLGYRVNAEIADGVWDYWNVAEVDLKPTLKPVTEAEIAEVYKILGVET